MAASTQLTPWHEALRPELSALGFKKRVNAYVREHGRADHLVAFTPASAAPGFFYVDVAIVLGTPADAVKVAGKAVSWSRRIEQIVPSLPAKFAYDAPAALIARVVTAVVTAASMMEPVKDEASALEALDLSAGFAKCWRAQLKQAVGDYAGAWSDLEAVAAEFGDRNGCDPPALARRYRISHP